MSETVQVKENTNNHKPDSNVKVIYSFPIAQALVVDYPHFANLITTKINKHDDKKKKKVWLFKATPELEEHFGEIVQERKAAREAKNKEYK